MTPIFTAHNVSKAYRRGSAASFALSPFSFELRLGEITGVVGENGAGKSTTLKIAAGELRSDTGNVSYPQFNAEPGEWQTIKSQIAYIPQRIRPWKGIVRDNLVFTACVKGVAPERAHQQAEQILERLGLSQYRNYFWDEMSGGFQMRMELARMLVWQPRLLILDEPLANLDIKTQSLFLKDLRDISLDPGHPMAIAVSSQHLYRIEHVADHLLFIQQGKVVYNGPANQVGAARAHNSFELSVDAPVEQVRLMLAELNPLRVDDQGETLLIELPLETSGDQLLAFLLQRKLRVKYFRDISHSTRTFFEEQP